ncbi:hypothetical protein Ddye_025550 [Dipteronia dyeriana]|uniref:Uncharacterized protein n=1 Tax=Dipteronia dyeriana TaxID=168575 RepID=A0AAD9WPP7_9ROSI|nr:hypothetical protein Ddye_025550 [Dipteronia dyeriana]
MTGSNERQNNYYREPILSFHKNVKDCDVAQAQSLRSVGVKTSQVMDHQLDQSGSYAATGHMGKDLQSRLDRIRRSSLHNSDIDLIVSYSEAEMDPVFFFKYTILDDGSMINLFWYYEMS